MRLVDSLLKEVPFVTSKLKSKRNLDNLELSLAGRHYTLNPDKKPTEADYLDVLHQRAKHLKERMRYFDAEGRELEDAVLLLAEPARRSLRHRKGRVEKDLEDVEKQIKHTRMRAVYEYEKKHGKEACENRFGFVLRGVWRKEFE